MAALGSAELLFEYRRPTASWVTVSVRRLREYGLIAVVLRKGEPRRGSVVLKLKEGDSGWRLMSQARSGDGQSSWIEGLAGRAVDEAEAEAYLARQISRDPDLWIIEIQHCGSPSAG